VTETRNRVSAPGEGARVPRARRTFVAFDEAAPEPGGGGVAAVAEGTGAGAADVAAAVGVVVGGAPDFVATGAGTADETTGAALVAVAATDDADTGAAFVPVRRLETPTYWRSWTYGDASTT
jgi:hypothetical protein